MRTSTFFSFLLVLIGFYTCSCSVPPSPAGYQVMWLDDFNQPAKTRLSSSSWIYTTGTSYPGGPAQFGTGEIERMTSSLDNVYHDGKGNLVIQAIKDTNGSWTSGRVETLRTDFMPPVGGSLIVEGRMQLPEYTGPAASGLWSAFWMLGGAFRGNYKNWPGVGEIDIMENVNGLNRIFGVLHCGVIPGGDCNEPNGKANETKTTNLQSQMHVYRLVWGPDSLTWFLDNNQFHKITKSQLSSATWNSVTNHGYFIILNLAIGGGFPTALGGDVTNATGNNAKLVIDYVAVWKSISVNSNSSAIGVNSSTTRVSLSGAPISTISNNFIFIWIVVGYLFFYNFY